VIGKVLVTSVSSQSSKYSTDSGATWTNGGTIPSLGGTAARAIISGPDRFVGFADAQSGSPMAAYSVG